MVGDPRGPNLVAAKEDFAALTQGQQGSAGPCLWPAIVEATMNPTNPSKKMNIEKRKISENLKEKW